MGPFAARKPQWLIQTLGAALYCASLVALCSSCDGVSIRREGTIAGGSGVKALWDYVTSSEYTVSGAAIVSGGVCKLPSLDQTDDDLSSGGFAVSGMQDAVWDTNGYVRISSTTDGSLTSSWVPQAGSLRAYYKLSGTPNSLVANGTILTAAIGNNATTSNANGTGMQVLGGIQGQGMFYDGVDDQISAPISQGPITALSISVWVRSPVGTAGNAYIVKVTDGTSYLSLSVDGSGRPTLSSQDSGFGYLSSFYNVRLIDGGWHHLAGVRDPVSQSLNFYVDGVLRASIADSRSGTFSQTSVLIGEATFSGVVDEPAFWTSALTAAEIRLIYERQRSQRSGIYTSRILDGSSSTPGWTTMGWKSRLPTLKPIPAAGAESAADYPAISGTAFTQNLEGLWHFDETATTAGASNDFLDSSGNGRHGEAVGGSVFGFVPGRFNGALLFDGSSTQIQFGNVLNFAGTAPFTISLWFRTDLITSSRALIGKTLIDGSGLQGWLVYLSGTALMLERRLNGTQAIAAVNGQLHDQNWHHYVGVYTGTQLISYLDGVAGTPTADTRSIISTAEQIEVGYFPTGPHFSGAMDELAIWSRALPASEIQQLYRRGANRLQYQIRQCTSVNCADDPGQTLWKGPDNTSGTYFTETLNSSLTTPLLSFASFPGVIGSGRYLQYRVVLESDDLGTSCNYGAGATWCSPELLTWSAGPAHFDAAGGSVISINSRVFTSVSALTETLGASGCSAGVLYNLGTGATSAAAIWYWWDNAAASGAGKWVVANGTAAQANSVAVVNAHLASFPAGGANVYSRGYLQSSGISACELDQLELEGQH